MKDIPSNQLVTWGNSQTDPSRFDLPIELEADAYALGAQPKSSEHNALFRNITQASYTIYTEQRNFLINNGISPNENSPQQIYELLRQLLSKNGNREIWQNDIAYDEGAVVGKIASWSGLGSSANQLTIFYRSKSPSNLGNVLPADFLDNTFWEWVDVGQPSSLNLIDLSGHVGEVRTSSANISDLPKNWKICDGSMASLPNGGSINLPNLDDLIPVLKQDNQLGIGGDWNYTFQVSGYTDGHALTIAELPPHNHTYGYGGAAILGGPNQITVLGSSIAQTGFTGNGEQHSHFNNFAINSNSNRPPYVHLLPIFRIF